MWHWATTLGKSVQLSSFCFINLFKIIFRENSGRGASEAFGGVRASWRRELLILEAL